MVLLLFDYSRDVSFSDVTSFVSSRETPYWPVTSFLPAGEIHCYPTETAVQQHDENAAWVGPWLQVSHVMFCGDVSNLTYNHWVELLALLFAS